MKLTINVLDELKRNLVAVLNVCDTVVLREIRQFLNQISFQTFFVWAFKIVVDTWKLSMLLLYILWDDWPTFMISGSNEQLQQQLEYTQLKPDCHSWWISKMQSGRENTLKEWYAIKFCFKLGKNATETYGMLQTALGPSCMNQTSVFERQKRFKEGMESVRDGERCGRSKEVITPESENLSYAPRKIELFLVFIFLCLLWYLSFLLISHISLYKKHLYTEHIQP